MTWLREASLNLIIALVVSLLLWAFVTYTTNPDDTEVYEGVPVAVRGLSPGMVMVDQNGLPRPDTTTLDTATVAVETDRQTLAQLRQSDISAFVDLSGLNSGTHAMGVLGQANRNNIRIVNVIPDELSVRLEQVITNTVPLTIELEGALPFSYERGEPELTFNDEDITEVAVSGPQNRVERVTSASVTVDIDQLRVTYASEQELQAVDANGDPVDGVTLRPDTVNVRIPIRSVVGIKLVPVLGNVMGSPAPGYLVTGVESDPSLVDIVGNSNVLNAIDWVNTEPIDISNATRTITREVEMNFRGARPQDDAQETAQVVVRISPLDQPFQVQVPVPVQVTGVSNDLLVTTSPSVVQVTLEGETNDFFQLRVDLLSATIDVAGLESGRYTFTPEIDVPDGITLLGDVPEVTLDLRRPPTPTPRPTTTPLPLPLPPSTQTLVPTPTSGEGAQGATPTGTPVSVATSAELPPVLTPTATLPETAGLPTTPATQQIDVTPVPLGNTPEGADIDG